MDRFILKRGRGVLKPLIKQTNKKKEQHNTLYNSWNVITKHQDDGFPAILKFKDITLTNHVRCFRYHYNHNLEPKEYTKVFIGKYFPYGSPKDKALINASELHPDNMIYRSSAISVIWNRSLCWQDIEGSKYLINFKTGLPNETFYKNRDTLDSTSHPEYMRPICYVDYFDKTKIYDNLVDAKKKILHKMYINALSNNKKFIDLQERLLKGKKLILFRDNDKITKTGLSGLFGTTGIHHYIIIKQALINYKLLI